MLPLTTVTTLVNSLTLVMTLGFLIIIIWHDRRKEQNQFFALFLFAVAIWSAGTLLLLASSVIGINEQRQVQLLASGIMRAGFSGAVVGIYALTAILVSVRPRFFKTFVGLTLLLLFFYQVLVEQRFSQSLDAGQLYRSGIGSYLVFGATTLYLLWRYRARVSSYALQWGIFAFVVGQGISALEGSLQTLSVSIMISSAAVLVLGLSLLRREIILPLRDRNSQVEAMHSMSLAVTSQLAVQTVFQQIVQQAEQWLRADAVALFVREQDFIQVAEVAGLPRQFVDRKLLMGVGVSGRVITTKQSILLENYATDWTDDPDMPLATETFGAVVCVPLVAADESIGALMVIAGKHNRAFNGEDVNLLEMLGAQAAVAITHSQSFDKQQLLAQEIEQARNQLQTVLSSTKNPVIAVNQRFELIVSNDAAEQLFPEIKYASPITDVVPSGVLPGDLIDDYRAPISHTYMEEVVLADRIYQSHVAAIGHGDQIDGWVTVMTDVTGLKELDRIKSEMVRMTSHDLKNPLQAALANTELLIDMLEGYHDNDVHDSIAVIDKQLTRMYRIISGVLDMERFRTGKQAMNICAPDVIISNTVGDFRTIAADRRIAVTIDVAPDILPVMGDAGQLERALSNLVENAIKFTPDGGEVDVKAYSEDGNTFFEIKDTGIGIPVSEQSKVFDSFYRAKQRGAEHISGTGLGLHLVKTVIENHEGQVWLDSNGHGTTFYISIPSATDSILDIR